jgi:hypothetical protein
MSRNYRNPFVSTLLIEFLIRDNRQQLPTVLPFALFQFITGLGKSEIVMALRETLEKLLLWSEIVILIQLEIMRWLRNINTQEKRRTWHISMRIIIPEKRMGVIQSIINVGIVECAAAKFILLLIVSAWLSATFRFVDPREIF